MKEEKSNKKVRNKYWNIPSILFNIFETIMLVVFGLLFKISYRDMVIVFLSFEISRFYFKMPKHYKEWQKCLIWTLIIFVSTFVVARVDITVGVMCSVFIAYILSGKADIKDTYMWSGKVSKYDSLRDFVGISPNNPIILDYESYWRVNYPLRYEIFKLFYRERKSYQEIRDIKGYDENNLIKTECKSIYEQLEKPLSLPPLKK